MTKFSYGFFLFLALVLILFTSACKKDENPESAETATYSHKVATEWFNQFRNLTKKCSGFTPPVTARAFGYCGVTLYETVVAGMPAHQSLAGQLDALNDVPKPDSEMEINYAIAANAALADAARYYYANMSDNLSTVVDNLEATMEEELAVNISAASLADSKAYGKTVSAFIYEWSKTDGGHEGYLHNFPTDFVVPTGEGLWVPTSAQLIPLQPYWGSNRTFITSCSENSQPETGHTPFSTETSSNFYLLANEVYTTSINLTEEQETIARYWSDDPGEPGTPPGHSISIALQILQNENEKLDKAAITLAKVGIALSDAFVSCWKCKYDYNLLRPVTYINNYIDPNWVTLLSTPPFPEFVSGHSTQTAAFATVMNDLFGSQYSFTDHTHEARTDIDGSPRHYNNFNECAQEAAISRLYGGIHYSEGNEKGLIMGTEIGDMVNQLNL